MSVPSTSVRAPVPSAARRQLSTAAALQRFHPERVAEITAAKREATVLTLEDHIRRVVDAAPPLTAAQRDRLAQLLRGDAA